MPYTLCRPSKQCTTPLSNCTLTIVVWEGLGSELAFKHQKLQNPAARIITFSSFHSSSSPLLQKLRWDGLSICRIKLLPIEMFKVYNNMVPKYLCQKFLKMRSTYCTRGFSSRVQLPIPNIN